MIWIFHCGLTQQNGTVWGDEAQTEWVQTTFTHDGSFNVHNDTQFSFDTSTISRNDFLGFVFMRGGGTAQDTNVDNMAVMAIKMCYQTDEFGQETDPT